MEPHAIPAMIQLMLAVALTKLVEWLLCNNDAPPAEAGGIEESGRKPA